MKRVAKLVALGAAVALLSGCASTYPVGGLFQDLQMPVAATGEGSGKKMGEAECSSILGMVAMGDCSIQTAKKKGKITKVSHVDWKVKNILGIIGNYKVVVYGD